MSYYNDPAFIKLQKEWYKKLADSGFKDIEEFDEVRGSAAISFLKRSCKDLAKKYNDTTFFYYQLCRDFLSHGFFLSKIDHKIWQLHSEGVSIREILKELQQDSTLNFPHSIFWIFTRLNKLKKDMYLWQSSQESEGN